MKDTRITERIIIIINLHDNPKVLPKNSLNLFKILSSSLRVVIVTRIILEKRVPSTIYTGKQLFRYSRPFEYSKELLFRRIGRVRFIGLNDDDDLKIIDGHLKQFTEAKTQTNTITSAGMMTIPTRSR